MPFEGTDTPCSHCGRGAFGGEQAGYAAVLCNECLEGSGKSYEFIRDHAPRVEQDLNGFLSFLRPDMLKPSALSALVIGGLGGVLEQAEVVLIGFASMGTIARMEPFTARLRTAIQGWAALTNQALEAAGGRDVFPSMPEINGAADLLMASLGAAVDAWTQAPKWRRAVIGLAQRP